MTDTSIDEPNLDQEQLGTQEPSPWPKRLKLMITGLILLLVVAYFFIGSSFFLRSVVLPSIEKSMMATIQVEDVSLSPFSQIELKGLIFTPYNSETLVSAKGALVRYSLLTILGGTIKLDQLQLMNPEVIIIEAEDGKSNLSSWLASLPPSPNAPLPVMDLNLLSVENGKVILRQKTSGGGQNVTELLLNKVSIGKLGQDLEGPLNLDIGVKTTKSTDAGEETQLALSMKLEGDLGLNAELFPEKSTLNGQLKVESATGAYADMVGVNGDLILALKPGSIDDVSLSMMRNGQAAGNIRVMGPFDFATSEGRIVAAFDNLNRQFLNLAGAVAGIDFKETVMDGSLTMTLTNGGNLLALAVTTTCSNVSIGTGEGVTPPLNVELDTTLNYDADGEKLTVQQFGLTVADGATPTITGALLKPVTFAWNGQPESFQEPEFNFNITNFNLGDWRDFTFDTLNQGELFGDFSLKVEQSGARMQADFTGGFKDADVAFDGHTESGTSGSLNLKMVFEDYTRVTLERLAMEWSSTSGNSLVSFSGSGSHVLGSKGYNLHTEAKADLALMKPFVNMDGLSIEQGLGELSLRLRDSDDDLSGVLQMALRDYTGSFSGMSYESYTVGLNSEFAIRDEQLKLGTTQIDFHEDFNDGGTIGIKGEMDLERETGAFMINSVGINRFALSPFLTPFSNVEDFTEVTLNLEAELQLDLNGESTLKGNTSLSNLKVKDPESERIKELQSELDLDLAWNTQHLEIRPSFFKLTPTSLADNVIKVSGQIPLLPFMASKGNLRVSSPSMDLTSYFDLIAKPEEAQVEVQPVSTPDVASAPQSGALDVPMGEFDVKLDIAKLIVRDISLKAFQAHALWQTNTLTIRPLSMTLNEGLIKAEMAMDFAKPDWGYDMTLEVDQIPIEAFIDTLSPSQKGQVSGMISGKAEWKGAGLTETGWQRNLNGAMSLKYTDADINFVSPKMRLLMTPITAVLRLPELLKAPINGIETNLKIENQILALDAFKVQSDAFQIHASGEIPLDNVLTNSVLNLPVEFYLERSIARKSNLMPSSAPKETSHVKLPDFVKLEGTIGAPKTKTDKLVLSGLLVKSGAGLVKSAAVLPLNVGEGAVKVLKDVGGFLTGDSKTSKQGDEGENNKEEKSGILEQVNPLKLLDNFRNRGGDQ
ncbi:AsmA family protein [Verrucomicrobia bacterium]|nr:AsmA family protein [Verrucomicrobiota bacterium]